MSVNKRRPHVFVLPEDDANTRLANGFHLHPSVSTWRMQVLPEAGGWRNVLDSLCSNHAAKMECYPDRMMVLLIDFDGKEQRRQQAMGDIPDHLRDRVFVLGSWTEPEDLRKDLGDYETIGAAMAEDCRDGTDNIWRHRLLRHNSGELDRLRQRICPILFPSV